MSNLEIFNTAKDEIDRYSKYTPNWDGYYGRPFSSKVINFASGLINAIEKYCDILSFPILEIETGPAGDGTIDLTFTFKNHSKQLYFLLDDEDKLVNLHEKCEQYFKEINKAP